MFPFTGGARVFPLNQTDYPIESGMSIHWKNSDERGRDGGDFPLHMGFKNPHGETLPFTGGARVFPLNKTDYPIEADLIVRRMGRGDGNDIVVFISSPLFSCALTQDGKWIYISRWVANVFISEIVYEEDARLPPFCFEKNKKERSEAVGVCLSVDGKQANFEEERAFDCESDAYVRLTLQMLRERWEGYDKEEGE
jgi:hypothetical protein